MGSVTSKVKNVVRKINPWADSDDEESEEINTTDCDDDPPLPLRIVERKELGLKKPKWRQELKRPVDAFVLRYFTDTPECHEDKDCIKRIKYLQDKHMEMGMPDIAWNFLIGSDGTVYEARGWETKPTKTDYQTLPYDGKSIDVAFIGDFNTTYPHPAMNEAMCRLMRRGVKLGHANEGWDLEEVADVPPHAPWTPERFMTDKEGIIYDETTEPPPEEPVPAETVPENKVEDISWT